MSIIGVKFNPYSWTILGNKTKKSPPFLVEVSIPNSYLMSIPKNKILLFILLGLFSSCQKWNLEPTDFPQLEWQNLSVNSLFSITVTANIAGLDGGRFAEHGFLYSATDEEPRVSKINTTKIDLGASVSNKDFSHRLSDLTINVVYFLRAYAIYDSEILYSEVIRYDNQSALKVLTQNTTIIAGENTGIISGSIDQIPPGVLVERYGHCWSTQNPEPTILGTASNLGTTDQDISGFTITLTDMEPLQPYYVRSYAVVDGIAIYGEVVEIIKKDAWKQKASFPFEEIGVTPITFMIDDQIHAITWRKGDTKQEHYVYDPAVDEWTLLGEMLGPTRDIQRACSVGGKGYVGMGKGLLTSGLLTDMWEFNTDKKWCEKQAFPGTPRMEAIMLGIKDKVYYGTGITFSDEYLADFWEFDPNDESNGFNACGDPMGAWTELPSYPGGGRHSVGYFVRNDKAYMGGGTSVLGSDQELFLEFEPDSNPLWVEKQGFARIERWRAAAFVVKDKAYYGMGNFFGVDFHEYNPQDTINGYDVKGRPMGSWKQVNNFASSARYGAEAYTSGGKGYLFFGFTADNIYFPEVWSYEPDDF